MSSKRKMLSPDPMMPPTKCNAMEQKEFGDLDGQRSSPTNKEEDVEDSWESMSPLEKLPNEILLPIVEMLGPRDRAALYPLNKRMNQIVKRAGLLPEGADYVYVTDKILVHHLEEERIYVMKDRDSYYEYMKSLGDKEQKEEISVNQLPPEGKMPLRYVLGEEYKVILEEYLGKRYHLGDVQTKLDIERMNVTDSVADQWKFEIMLIQDARPLVLLCTGEENNDSLRAPDYIPKNRFRFPEYYPLLPPFILYIDPNGSAFEKLDIGVICELRNWPPERSLSILQVLLSDNDYAPEITVFTWQLKSDYHQFAKLFSKQYRGPPRVRLSGSFKYEQEGTGYDVTVMCGINEVHMLRKKRNKDA